jgi:hypothetical protein
MCNPIIGIGTVSKGEVSDRDRGNISPGKNELSLVINNQHQDS